MSIPIAIEAFTYDSKRNVKEVIIVFDNKRFIVKPEIVLWLLNSIPVNVHEKNIEKALDCLNIPEVLAHAGSKEFFHWFKELGYQR